MNKLWLLHPRDSSLPTYLVYGCLEEIIQQKPCLSQGAGADHHRGVSRIQFFLARKEKKNMGEGGRKRRLGNEKSYFYPDVAVAGRVQAEEVAVNSNLLHNRPIQ